MMKKLIWAVLPIVLLLSCKDEEAQPATTVAFEEPGSEVEESGTYKVVNVVMNQAQETDVEVSFERAGSAELNGHYTLVTPSPITIEAGATHGEIVFQVLDYTVLEPVPPTIIFELTEVSGAQLGEESSLIHETRIIDPKEAPENELQLDLLWSLGPGEDIDQVDLDFMLITDVVIENNEVRDFSIYDVSEEDSGFETVLIQEDYPDQDYYIIVVYIAGDRQVDFFVNASNVAIGTGLLVHDEFSETEGGGGLRIYGPIPKEGGAFFGERRAETKFSAYKMSETAPWPR